MEKDPRIGYQEKGLRIACESGSKTMCFIDTSLYKEEVKVKQEQVKIAVIVGGKTFVLSLSQRKSLLGNPLFRFWKGAGVRLVSGRYIVAP